MDFGVLSDSAQREFRTHAAFLLFMEYSLQIDHTMKTKLSYFMLVTALALYSCGGSDDENPDPCAVPVVLSISSQTQATNGQSDGSVTVTATGGNGGYQYRINNGAFQSSGTFNDLAAGSYTVNAQDSEGCMAILSVTIEEGDPEPVPSFASDVLPIMELRCATSGCHVSGGSAPFVIEGFADVQPRAASIRARVSGRTMPPAGSTALTDAQIATIVDWVDGGAPNN